MPQILKSRCNFTLRLGNTSLEQNMRSKTLGYFLFIRFTIAWLAKGQLLTVIEETVSLTQ